MTSNTYRPQAKPLCLAHLNKAILIMLVLNAGCGDQLRSDKIDDSSIVGTASKMSGTLIIKSTDIDEWSTAHEITSVENIRVYWSTVQNAQSVNWIFMDPQDIEKALIDKRIIISDGERSDSMDIVDPGYLISDDKMTQCRSLWTPSDGTKSNYFSRCQSYDVNEKLLITSDLPGELFGREEVILDKISKIISIRLKG